MLLFHGSLHFNQRINEMNPRGGKISISPILFRAIPLPREDINCIKILSISTQSGLFANLLGMHLRKWKQTLRVNNVISIKLQRCLFIKLYFFNNSICFYHRLRIGLHFELQQQPCLFYFKRSHTFDKFAIPYEYVIMFHVIMCRFKLTMTC